MFFFKFEMLILILTSNFSFFLLSGILNGLLNEDDSFLRVCVDTLRTQHKLLSFLSPPLAGAVVFHRPERVVCIYAHILCSLGVCSLFYGKDPNSIPKKISKAVITSVSISKAKERHANGAL